MKRHNFGDMVKTAIFGLCMGLALTGFGADTMTRLTARSGSKMRLEGTSNIHDWQSEATLIGGAIEVGPGFPLEAGQEAKPGKVEVKGEAWVSVNMLKSKEKDGKAYSDRMDEVLAEKLKADTNPRIIYRPTELNLTAAPKAAGEPYVFDSKGELEVAGVTNTVAFPVQVTFTPEKKIKISGTTNIKMSDYKVQPPTLTIANLGIRTSDNVKIIFDWMVAPAKPAAAAK